MKPGRIQKLELEINGQIDSVFNIYGPNEDDATFYDTLDVESSILRIGPIKNSQVRYCPEKKSIWTSEGTQTLGIFGTNETNKLTEININDRID